MCGVDGNHGIMCRYALNVVGGVTDCKTAPNALTALEYALSVVPLNIRRINAKLMYQMVCV